MSIRFTLEPDPLIEIAFQSDKMNHTATAPKPKNNLTVKTIDSDTAVKLESEPSLLITERADIKPKPIIEHPAETLALNGLVVQSLFVPTTGSIAAMEAPTPASSADSSLKLTLS